MISGVEPRSPPLCSMLAPLATSFLTSLSLFFEAASQRRDPAVKEIQFQDIVLTNDQILLLYKYY